MTDSNMEIILNALGKKHVQGQTAEKCSLPVGKCIWSLAHMAGERKCKAACVHENQTVSRDLEHSIQASFEAGNVRSGEGRTVSVGKT